MIAASVWPSSGARRSLAAFLVLVAVIGCAVPTAAAPSPPPAAYYGDLTVNGDPAPEGLTITAEIGGEVRGSLTTSQTGAYGGPGAFDSKLQVDGQSSDEGVTVQFFIEGQAAGTTTWHSGDVRALDLSATGVDLDSAGSSGDGGTSSDDGGSDSPSPTPPSTETPTATPTAGTPTGGSDAVTSGGADNISVTTNGSGVSVNVTGAQSGQQVTINLSSATDSGSGTASSSNASVGSDNVTFDALTITSAVDGDFTLGVSVSETMPAGTPMLPGGVATIGYLVVDHSLADDNINGVTFAFRVRKSRLSAMGIEPEDLTLSRLHDGTWTELQTVPKDETTTHYLFETASPGLSMFALATKSDTTSQGAYSGDSMPDSSTTDSSSSGSDVGTPATAVEPASLSLSSVALGLGAVVALTATLLAVRRFR